LLRQLAKQSFAPEASGTNGVYNIDIIVLLSLMVKQCFFVLIIKK
jgi:hypothetical protein